MLQEFAYISPNNSKELCEILKKHQRRAKILAGGTDLLVDIRAGKNVPSFLVDLKNIPELKKIELTKEGLSIGAAVTCSEVINNGLVQKQFPLIADAAIQIGSPQVRNRATVIGNICTSSPSADMAPVLLCLGAFLKIDSFNSTRNVDLKDFFTGVKKNVLKEFEVVSQLIIPASMAKVSGGFEKLKRVKGHDLALASAAMVKRGNSLRLAIGACATTPIVLPDFPQTTPVEKVKKMAIKAVRPIDDVRASKDYRMFMIQVQIERLMVKILDQEFSLGFEMKLEDC
ncbi:xanthine dehydrogenase family protein subunit M [bacterium]|nr:xanthine dehydrogenase family protein subunit M [bacterium]